MSEMKCPFCGEKLQQTYSFNPTQFWCSNYYDHTHPINLQGTKELWQELIRTRKALDAAIRGLDQMTWGCDSTDAEYLLKEIKEIMEQKDK